MMMLIMEKEKEMLQEQTQLLLQQLNTCQSSYTAPYSFSAFNFPTNFVGQPRFQQFPKPSLPQLETISNQSPRFVKIPLSTVETARKVSVPKLVIPSLTPTPSPVSIPYMLLKYLHHPLVIHNLI
ncbi:unnamed protein product [Lasius platythorax]|uniref:Uncharacterized protein n=1 Tax=Lasius platythorax TaxID=488582 RepID=A0AAV2NNQ3_9HYME